MTDEIQIEFVKKENSFIIKPEYPEKDWSKLPVWILQGSVVLAVIGGMTYLTGQKLASRDKADIALDYANMQEQNANLIGKKADSLMQTLNDSMSVNVSDTIEGATYGDNYEAIIANLIHEGGTEKVFENQIKEYQFIAKSMKNRFDRFDSKRFKTVKGMIYGWASSTALNYSWTSDKSLPRTIAGLKSFNPTKFKAAEVVAKQYMNSTLPDNGIGISTHYITPKALLECQSKGCAYFENKILRKDACLSGQKGQHIYMYIKESPNEQCH